MILELQDTLTQEDVLEAMAAIEGDVTEYKSDSTWKVLHALNMEAQDCIPDWEHGEQLIRDSHFKDYAQELAEDCGMVDNRAVWPNTCIDWERAARELQYDYTSIDVNGVTYYGRA